MEGVVDSGSPGVEEALSEFLRSANLSELEPFFLEEGFTELADVVEADFDELKPFLVDRVQRGKLMRLRRRHNELRKQRDAGGGGSSANIVLTESEGRQVERLLTLMRNLTNKREHLDVVQQHRLEKMEGLRDKVSRVFADLRSYLDQEESRVSSVLDEMEQRDNVSPIQSEIDVALHECASSKQEIEKVCREMNGLDQWQQRKQVIEKVVDKSIKFEELLNRSIPSRELRLNVVCPIDFNLPVVEIEIVADKVISATSTSQNIEWDPLEDVDAFVVQVGLLEEKQANEEDLPIVGRVNCSVDSRELNLMEWIKNENFNEKLMRARVLGTTHDGVVVVAKSKWIEIVARNAFKSVIINGREGDILAKYVRETMHRESSFELLYRASTHGDGADVFHRNCDQGGVTIAIICDEWGNVFGGFNMINWATSGGWVSSSANWLFLVRSAQGKHVPKKFMVIRGREGHAAINNGGCGPTFGSGHDIRISSNCRSNNKSYSAFGHTYENEGDSRYLTNERNFKVSDYEVFAVKA